MSGRRLSQVNQVFMSPDEFLKIKAKMGKMQIAIINEIDENEENIVNHEVNDKVINEHHVKDRRIESDDTDDISSNGSEIIDTNQAEPEPVSVEDAIFDLFKDESDTLCSGKFLSALEETGLLRTDPRLKDLMTKLKEILKYRKNAQLESMSLDRDEFYDLICDNLVLISKALRHQFVIPDFEDFTRTIRKFYYSCKDNKGGKPADYIPQLARFNPEYWGISVCTVDGQRYSIGDTEIPFTIQSSSKPINYSIALSELGCDTVHKYVGQEPSGRMFNELVLDSNDKPHNPMVNAGAIMVCSLLLNVVKDDMKISEKFDWVCEYYKAMAGGEYLGFNNATFLSEREAADRNYAIGYYMREHKCFPPKTILNEVMDFYFQLCSLEVNCQSVGVIAATLANGGICPITSEQVIKGHAVRDVLSLMHSCGMYDYSGKFAFNIGLPAKSGVSGCLILVVPNVAGFCCWSPPLDQYGNSVRGVQFCSELVSLFNFHHYDNLRHIAHKQDPRLAKDENKGLRIVSLLFSAASGDVTAMRRYYLSGMDLELRDYDGRTALHLAASEGHLECVEFLVKICGVNYCPQDRKECTPLEDAIRFDHTEVVDFLKNWAKKNPQKRGSRQYVFSPRE